MGRRNKGQKIDGWINLLKPEGLTSTQALGKVRRIFDAQKAGHAGTLDPLASGVLPLALGEATKTISFMQDKQKGYVFTVKWGEQTDTDDREGRVINISKNIPCPNDIEAILPEFLGDIEQVPPQYSAIKVQGKRAYDLARSGEAVELKSRIVRIETLEILKTCQKTAQTTFKILCGKGTYIRSLARDMALKLNSFGHVSYLQRTQVGGFLLENAISLEKLAEMRDSSAEIEALLPVQEALDDIPALSIKEQEIIKLQRGQVLNLLQKPDYKRLTDIGLGEKSKQTALALFQNRPIALIEVIGAEVKPIRVFNL